MVRAKPKIIRTVVDASVQLPWQCWWSDKLGILFKPCHCWWTYSNFFIIMGHNLLWWVQSKLRAKNDAFG